MVLLCSLGGCWELVFWRRNLCRLCLMDLLIVFWVVVYFGSLGYCRDYFWLVVGLDGYRFLLVWSGVWWVGCGWLGFGNWVVNIVCVYCLWWFWWFWVVDWICYWVLIWIWYYIVRRFVVYLDNLGFWLVFCCFCWLLFCLVGLGFVGIWRLLVFVW